MRTSVFVLLAVVVGYFAYNLWFAPEEEIEQSVRLIAEEPAESDEAPLSDDDEARSAETDGPQGLSIRPDLTLGDGSDAPVGQDPAGSGSNRRESPAERAAELREEQAWKYYAQLKDARNGRDKSKTAKLEVLLGRTYKDTDAGRMLLFDRGRVEFRRWQNLGRSPEGLRAAHQARKLFTPALFMQERPDPQQHADLRETLAELADAVLFGSGTVDGVVYTYKTRSGDALSKLCYRVFPTEFGVRTAPGLVMKMNGIRRPQDLKAGVHIRIPAGKPSIVVVKREFRAYYLLDGVYVRDWPVGLGAQGSTPVGEFSIASKIENPDWFPKQGVKIRYGDPQNILGTRWMGFKNTPGLTGFGIHGTTKPESIGRSESSGCIRMDRADVEELFGWTPYKTKVVITR